jgi:hypothetical protein
MDLYAEIIKVYPELTTDDFLNGVVTLQDDGDGTGAYIREWNYFKPIPASLTSYKR